MKSAWVLMTAMPPTTGHAALIDFAANLVNVSDVNVVLGTQPDEPFVDERFEALNAYCMKYPNVFTFHYDQPIQQVPTGDDDADFWEMWRDILFGYGQCPGDYIVSSEMYGMKLAEVTDCEFMPFDLNRNINPIRGTDVREDPLMYFDYILPEFQRSLRKTVTIFGAESVGKTTLTNSLVWRINADAHADDYVQRAIGLPEWARPYLEAVGPEITEEKMRSIWFGQAAMQASAQRSADTPFIIQDTDLYSTYGYWNLWSPYTIPHGLFFAAENSKSDLYIIPQSNIPFEADPLRYGGDKRETSDDYWIGICEKFDLNYVVLRSDNRNKRVNEANEIILGLFDLGCLKYDRIKETV